MRQQNVKTFTLIISFGFPIVLNCRVPSESDIMPVCPVQPFANPPTSNHAPNLHLLGVDSVHCEETRN